jgi:hypothetical protein
MQGVTTRYQKGLVALRASHNDRKKGEAFLACLLLLN